MYLNLAWCWMKSYLIWPIWKVVLRICDDLKDDTICITIFRLKPSKELVGQAGLVLGSVTGSTQRELIEMRCYPPMYLKYREQIWPVLSYHWKLWVSMIYYRLILWMHRPCRPSFQRWNSCMRWVLWTMKDYWRDLDEE